MTSQPLVAPARASAAVKCACADLWAHPVAQLLAGPTLRPGGRELTGRVLDHLGLPAGARVLDVGSGTGATLSELGSRGLTPFGVDYSAALAAQAVEVGPIAVGDAEVLPYRSGAFEAVLAECVISALPDKHAALDEVRRVLAADGSIVVTDVVVDAEFPEPLQSLAGWAACFGGALSGDSYEALLRAHGFALSRREDASAALAALVSQAERRLAMLRGAIEVGILDDAGAMFGAELDRLGLPTSAPGLSALAGVVFAQARDAIERGELGYIALVATLA